MFFRENNSRDNRFGIPSVVFKSDYLCIPKTFKLGCFWHYDPGRICDTSMATDPNPQILFAWAVKLLMEMAHDDRSVSSLPLHYSVNSWE